MEKKSNFLTYEKCKEISSKFKSKNEFYTQEQSCYTTILRNGWYELLDHLTSKGDKYHRLIYVYEFPDRSCYIGLTFNIHKREKQHSEYPKSQVFKHRIKTGLIPTLIVKTNLLDLDKAVLMESEILNLYKSDGWNILNVAKTGSTGGMSSKSIEDCIKEVDKYTLLSDFAKNSPTYYWHMSRHNLTHLYDKLKRARKKTLKLI